MMRKTFLALLLGVASALGINAQTPTTAPVDSVSTAVATVMGPLINKNIVSMRNLGLNIDNKSFIDALAAYLDGKDTGFTPQSADAYIENRVMELHPEMRPQQLSVESQQAFIDSIAALPGAVKLPSGVAFVVVQEGEDEKPASADKVSVTYVGKLSDGNIFDQTEDGPVTFDVSGVVPGFSDGLQQMRPGGTYRIAIPASLAYGPNGIPGAIPGNAALDFTVTLLSVERAPAK